FARWHIWIGWLAGVPLLMWSVTGLIMTIWPIEEVRGDHLRAAQPEVPLDDIVLPRLYEPIRSAELIRQVDGPTWIVTGMDGRMWRNSAIDGSRIPPVIEEEAQRIAQASYAGPGRIENIAYVPAGQAAGGMRAGPPAWEVRYSTGTTLHVHDNTGQVIALHTPRWRIYDFAWGLHIMDLETRENTHHPILIGFAVIASLAALLGCILLFRRRKARVQ
ncbi:MAG TPA: PepSY domain-containing protein, partial [Erythrobacter sp.]|nr:PepSY domain-containing protein [Erythrobacter sp.]